MQPVKGARADLARPHPVAAPITLRRGAEGALVREILFWRLCTGDNVRVGVLVVLTICRREDYKRR